MKKILVLSFTLLMVLSISAQSFSFTDLETTLKSFSEEFVGTLPANSSAGNIWSDGYIGQLPHLGFGGVVSFTLVPTEILEPVTTLMGIDFAQMGIPTDYGLPIPAYAADAKLGGILLPFDAGIKLGYLPENTVAMGMNIDYFLGGINGRLSLVKENMLIPQISVGAAYNLMHGSISVPGVLPATTITLPVEAQVIDPTYTDVSMASGDLVFNWEASVIEANVQASKNLFFFTPFAGVSVSTAIASVGGGIGTDITVGSTAWSDIPEDHKIALQDAIGQEINADGIFINNAVNGMSYRVYGGTSLNLLILHVDVMLYMDLQTQAKGGSVGVHLQL